jgi:hypothetical protein
LSAITGVAHAVDTDARWNSASAIASIDAGSFGSPGWPTSVGRCSSKYVVAAPLSRNCFGMTVPLAVTTTPGCANSARTSGATLPSA